MREIKKKLIRQTGNKKWLDKNAWTMKKIVENLSEAR